MAAVETLLETFLSDDQLIKYIAREVRKLVKANRSRNHSHPNYSKIVSQIIDSTFYELQLGELVSSFLEKVSSKFQCSGPEYSEAEPHQIPSNRRKDMKNRQQQYLPDIPSVEIDLNRTQYINTQSLKINIQNDNSIMIDSPSVECKIGNQNTSHDSQEARDEFDHFGETLEEDYRNHIQFASNQSGEADLPELSGAITDEPSHGETPSEENAIDEAKYSRHVSFVDGLVSNTFYHREKHTPEEVPDLFYTHDESIRFQFDYDREAQRADIEGISWLDWMMKRTEEERVKHEEEDELLQHEYNDYWEGNEQYEEESQSGDEMWEF